MEWAKPEYSRNQIDKAARILMKGEPEWAILGEQGQAPFNAYWGAREIVDNWRSSHNYPLNTFKVTLRRKAAETEKDSGSSGNRVGDFEES